MKLKRSLLSTDGGGVCGVRDGIQPPRPVLGDLIMLEREGGDPLDVREECRDERWSHGSPQHEGPNLAREIEIRVVASLAHLEGGRGIEGEGGDPMFS